MGPASSYLVELFLHPVYYVRLYACHVNDMDQLDRVNIYLHIMLWSVCL